MTLTDIGIQRRGNGHAPIRAFERLGRYMRQPQIAVPRPGEPAARITLDRVRARPAVTPTVVGAVGLAALGLGLTQLVAPRRIARVVGLPERSAPLIRACGLRELTTGFGLVSDPTNARWLWARAAGDVLDVIGLGAVAGPHNPRAGRARAALGLVVLAGLADALLAARMQTSARTCREVRR